MGLITTKSCCFCLSLRTGGLIWGCLFLLSGISGIVESIYKRSHYSRYYYESSSFAEKIVLSQIIVLVSIAWLYGIYKKKASWMLAFVIENVVTLVGLVLFFAILLASLVIPALREYQILFMFFIPIIPLAVLQWHFTTVAYSLYKSVKEENNSKPATLYPVIESKV